MPSAVIRLDFIQCPKYALFTSSLWNFLPSSWNPYLLYLNNSCAVCYHCQPPWDLSSVESSCQGVFYTLFVFTGTSRKTNSDDVCLRHFANAKSRLHHHHIICMAFRMVCETFLIDGIKQRSIQQFFSRFSLLLKIP